MTVVPCAFPLGDTGGDDDGAIVGDDDANFGEDPLPRVRSAFRIRLALEAFLSDLDPFMLSTLLARGLLPPLTVASSSQLLSRLRPDAGESVTVGRKGCCPSASSIRKNAVTAVHPLCIFPSDSSAIRDRLSSTAWKAWFSMSGIGYVEYA